MNDEFTCQEMIEVVTDYLEAAMPSGDQERFERHISYCAGCRAYTEQMRETIEQTGRLPHEESLSPELRERIVAQFRAWRQSEDT